MGQYIFEPIKNPQYNQNQTRLKHNIVCIVHDSHVKL